MPTVEGFCRALETYIGFKEQPLGSNNVPGVTDRCGCNASWCAWCNMVLSVAYQDAGGAHNQWSVVAERRDAINGRDGWVWVEDPRDGVRGDWMVIDWTGNGVVDHIEGVVGVLGVGDYHTIGGNVSDRCSDQHRTAASGVIAGFARPPYDPAVIVSMSASPGGPVVEYKDADAAWDSNGQYHVVARGSDDHPWTNVWNASIGWSGWSKINDGLLLGSPKITDGPGGRLDCIGVGRDSAIWHMAKFPSAPWSAWHSLGGTSG